MKRTQTEMLVLAQLANEAAHGYALMERIRSSKTDSLVPLPVPSVYQTLRRLHKEGLISMLVQKSDSRPDQKIYSITEAGKSVLRGMGEATVDDLRKSELSVDAALLMADGFENAAEFMSRFLEGRIERLHEELSGVQNALLEFQTAFRDTRRFTEISFQHKIRLLKSEIDFHRKLLKDLG